MITCLERGADLHMAQLMPFPLTVSCFSKIQIGFTFLVPAHLGSPRKGPLNGCVCVLVTFCRFLNLRNTSCSKYGVPCWQIVLYFRLGILDLHIDFSLAPCTELNILCWSELSRRKLSPMSAAAYYFSPNNTIGLVAQCELSGHVKLEAVGWEFCSSH